jgi:hypothetical protein
MLRLSERGELKAPGVKHATLEVDAEDAEKWREARDQSRKWAPQFPWAFKHFKHMLYREKRNDKFPDELRPLSSSTSRAGSRSCTT